MKQFNYPDKSAYWLAAQMKKFRARTEETAYSEMNAYADHDRREVVRQIDWDAYDKVISQLEFTYLQRKKYGR
jgi:hypothetical protein